MFLLLGAINHVQSQSVCVNYSPFHSSRYSQGKFTEVLDEDSAVMKQNGISCIKYYTRYYGTPVIDYAQPYGHTIALGLYMGGSPSLLGSEIQAASCNPVVFHTIVCTPLAFYTIGNENLTPTNTEQFHSIISRLRTSCLSKPNLELPKRLQHTKIE